MTRIAFTSTDFASASAFVASRTSVVKSPGFAEAFAAGRNIFNQRRTKRVIELVLGQRRFPELIELLGIANPIVRLPRIPAQSVAVHRAVANHPVFRCHKSS